jgi:small subunit ribosomal protein S6
MSTHRQYELVYIVSPESGEQEVADLHTQVEAIVGRFGGQIEKTENWGRRRLAYEIGRHKEGTYVLEVINGPGEMVRELDRRLRVADAVVRHLTVRVDEELLVAERARAERAAHVRERRLARGLPAEPPPAEAGAAAGERQGEQAEGSDE